MDEVEYCLDTYALMEIAGANPKFAEFVTSPFVVTSATLAEFYSVLLREHDENTAEWWFNKLKESSVDVNAIIFKEAIKFRDKNRKKSISIFDAVGYVYALANNLLFVTGDKEFEGMKNVEFRKK